MESGHQQAGDLISLRGSGKYGTQYISLPLHTDGVIQFSNGFHSCLLNNKIMFLRNGFAS